MVNFTKFWDSPPGYRVQFYGATNSNQPEMKWCVFVEGRRGSIGKLIMDITCVLGTDSRKAHIKSIFVKPEFRGHDLGRWLLRLCLQSLHRRGFTLVELEAEEEVARDGRLTNLYAQCGFTKTCTKRNGVSEIKYNNDQSFQVIPMSCKLNVFNLPTVIPRLPNDSDLLGEVFRRQTFAFAIAMLNDCLLNAREELTVWQALEKLDRMYPGVVAEQVAVCEYARTLGQPDFVQLTILLRYLGQIQHAFVWSAGKDGDVEGKDRDVEGKDGDVEGKDGDVEGKDGGVNGKGEGVQGGKVTSAATHGVKATRPAGLPCWATTDNFQSWVVGCEIPRCIPGALSLEDEESAQVQPSELGCYGEGCGMDSVYMSWSNAEYLYQILLRSETTALPHEALSAIRFQSLDAWFVNDQYSRLQSLDDKDMEAKFWTKTIVDLCAGYSEPHATTNSSGGVDEDSARCTRLGELPMDQTEYYRMLIDKYIPGTLSW